jgi:hypothetical protein
VRDGRWFLLAICEVPEPPLNSDPVDFLGIDLGIVNIATTSDGEIMAGRTAQPDPGAGADTAGQAAEEEHSVRQAPAEEAVAQGGAAGAGHQPQDRETCGGRGWGHLPRP